MEENNEISKTILHSVISGTSGFLLGQSLARKSFINDGGHVVPNAVGLTIPRHTVGIVDLGIAAAQRTASLALVQSLVLPLLQGLNEMDLVTKRTPQSVGRIQSKIRDLMLFSSFRLANVNYDGYRVRNGVKTLQLGGTNLSQDIYASGFWPTAKPVQAKYSTHSMNNSLLSQIGALYKYGTIPVSGQLDAIRHINVNPINVFDMFPQVDTPEVRTVYGLDLLWYENRFLPMTAWVRNHGATAAIEDAVKSIIY